MLAGCRQFPVFHPLIKLGGLHVELIAVYRIPERIVLRDNSGGMRLDIRNRQIRIGICGDDKRSHRFQLSSFVGFIVFVKNRLISIIKIPKKIVNKGALTDKVMERAGGMCYNAIRYNSKEKECGMRFQEELISKIMTYFTVILLLGILVFEAWSLQRERTSRREAQESAASALDMLDEMTSQNARLEEENEALHEALEEWEPYLSLAESEEMVSLKRELFSHPALIPDQAVEALTEELAQERAEEQESPAEESQTAAEEEETESELVFEFHKDGGEPVFSR